MNIWIKAIALGLALLILLIFLILYARGFFRQHTPYRVKNLPSPNELPFAIAIASCRPVLVATDTNYQLRPKAIAQAITERTGAVVTISPNNPTGAVYSEEALWEVNQICRDRVFSSTALLCDRLIRHNCAVAYLICLLWD